jgi:hypothetical protein
LPEALRNGNPLKLARMVDGQLTQPEHDTAISAA